MSLPGQRNHHPGSVNMDPVTLNPTTNEEGNLVLLVTQGERLLGSVEQLKVGPDEFWASKTRRGRVHDVMFFDKHSQDDAVKHVLRRAL